MDYAEYKRRKSNYKSIETISWNFGRFNPDIDQISKFKLIFILPDGECLLMLYDEHDEGQGLQYAHIAYIAKAIDLILEKLNINIEMFVKERIDKFDGDYFLAAIAKQNISCFYDCGYSDSDDEHKRYTIFIKPMKLTEKQEETLLTLKVPLKKEKYKIFINVLESDETLSRTNCITYSYTCENDPLKNICDEKGRRCGFNVDNFYKTMNVSNEQVL